ncbi:hydrophobin [Mycena vulgaris]|nr:hydrophobin [Mycena vulgaris]
MFNKLSTVVTWALTARAIITPLPPPDSLQCCATVVSSRSFPGQEALNIVHIDPGDLDDIPIGVSCTPIVPGGPDCDEITVICDIPDPAWQGLIAINCQPPAFRVRHGNDPVV